MASWQFFLGGVQIEEPIGFDKIEFSAKRLEGHGIDQSFSTEIQFIGSSAKKEKKSIFKKNPWSSR